MSRKVDLNAPRNSQNDYKKSHNNHSFSHGRIVNIGNNNIGDSQNVDNDDAGLANTSANNKDVFGNGTVQRMGNTLTSIDTSDKIKAVIRFVPPKVKFVLVALIGGLSLLGLMLFVVLFSNVNATDVSGYASLIKTCSKITVTDTGCDEKGINCTHEYDGDVPFEDYVAGVVAAVGEGTGNSEFYKVVSIVARTYLLQNMNDSCQISGNFMQYKSIDDAKDSSAIKEAVKDTSKMVLASDDKIVDANYSLACVVNHDENDYYLRYGINDNNYQKIPLKFDESNNVYNKKLESLYNMVDKSNDDYESRTCPSGNNSSGLSLIGALYLAEEENYNANEIISFYYGGAKVSRIEGFITGTPVDGFINPVEHLTCCSSPFSCRFHPIQHIYKLHAGVDISGVGANNGDPVYATKAGVVVTTKTNVPGRDGYSWGNYIKIDHNDGTMTLYAHLQYGGVLVSVGDKVEQGQQIGLVGDTGGATGYHLHYEVYVNGVQVDPYNYIDVSEVNSWCNNCYATSANSYDMSYCGR